MSAKNHKDGLLEQISQLTSMLDEAKALLEYIDPQDKESIAVHSRVIHRLLCEFIEKPVEFIPAGEGTLWRVPVTCDATISGTALVRAGNMKAAVEAACQAAHSGKVVMTIDEGNYRRIEAYYCPDHEAVEIVEPQLASQADQRAA